MLLVGGIHRAQDVEVDCVLAQIAQALHHLVKRSLVAPIETVRVVNLAGPVATDAHKKIVLLEEHAPLVVQKNSVGLKGVLDRLSRPTILLDNLDGLPKKLDLHERGFPALPSDRHNRRAMRLQKLLDIKFERLVRHPMLFIRIQGIFGQEKTVGAIDVAG